MLRSIQDKDNEDMRIVYPQQRQLILVSHGAFLKEWF